MEQPVGVLVGGVAQLYQGDLDVGRVLIDVIGDLPRGAVAEELHYGAVAVAQRLEDLAPHTLILVGAEVRGRPPATIERRRLDPSPLTPEDVHGAVSDAVQGYVAIDLVLDVANGLGSLPRRVVTIEIEPVRTASDPTLSAEVAAAVPELLRLVHAEVRRAPLLALAMEVRTELADGHLDASPALDALQSLLDQLDILDRDGRWGRTSSERDRLRYAIAAGDSAEGMRHIDWGLWWTLIEELDRLQPIEALAAAEAGGG